jgi:hypothetical protein
LSLESSALPWFRLIVRIMLLAGCLALAAAMVPDRAPDGDAEASLGTP